MTVSQVMRGEGASAAGISTTGPGRVAVSGPLTFSSVGTLAEADSGLLAAQSGQRLDVDLGGVNGVDSAGLALLVGWLAEARAAGVDLSYSGLPERLLAIARITDVDALVTGKVSSPSV